MSSTASARRKLWRKQCHNCEGEGRIKVSQPAGGTTWYYEKCAPCDGWGTISRFRRQRKT